MKKQCNISTDGQPSLACRLERLKQGLAGDDRVLDARLARMRRFPLTQWFGEHPERLEELCRAVPAIREDMTFGAAAAALWDARNTAWASEHLWLLLAPLLDIDRHMIKENDGSACYWGAR